MEKVESTCEWCGEAFLGRVGQKFCSKNCGSRASVERNKGKRKEGVQNYAAYAAAFPSSSSGAVRGRAFVGAFGKREMPRKVDVHMRKPDAVVSEWSAREMERQRMTGIRKYEVGNRN